MITLAKLDIAGKAVDKIIPPEMAFMLFIDMDTYHDINPAKLAVLSALRRLSVNPNKKNRLRDFIIYTGKITNSDGSRLFSICLPQKVSTLITKLFFEALQPSYHLDWSQGVLIDFSPEPLARYFNGKIIVYTPPSSPNNWLPEELEDLKSWGIDWETRSVKGPDIEDLRDQFKPRRISYGYIPQASLPEKPLNGKHTLQDHQRLSEALDKILFPTGKSAMAISLVSPPFGYKRLRELCKNYLGITVQEDTLPGGYSGILRVGYVSTDAGGLPSAQVLIRIDRALPTQTKYVALAHEIGCHPELCVKKSLPQEEGSRE